MREVNLSKPTEDRIKLLLSLCDMITYKYKVATGLNLDETNVVIEVDGKEVTRNAKELLDEILVDVAYNVFTYLKQMEDSHAGGYIDMGTSKALRLISEGDISLETLGIVRHGYQTIVNKLAIADIHNEFKIVDEDFRNKCAPFTGSKKNVG